VQIPEGLRKTIEQVQGERGLQWLAGLPDLLHYCCERWSLELEPPFKGLSYNLVLPGRLINGKEIVLKLGVPCRELTTECAALILFNGSGAVHLLEHDSARGILLMERVTPGTTVSGLLNERQATSVAAKLMKKLWRVSPADHLFQSLADWFLAFTRLRNDFSGGSGPFPDGLITRAEHSFDELNQNASTEACMVLHGDLHHANILLSKEEWLAIDPKGIVGDPGYEVGPFMLNRLPPAASNSELTELFHQRLIIFSDELRIDKNRLARWAFCHAVLSALWDWEEGKEWHPTIRLAEILEELVNQCAREPCGKEK
jgi:streptomycin 6-kinase